MFAYRTGRFKRPRWAASALALATLLALIAGCGGGEATDAAAGAGPTAGADAADLEVIEGWARALRGGDVDAAAAYFAIPSSAENGGLRVEIRSTADAVTFNESLPCGGEVVAATTAGEVTTATFELSDRPGGECGSGAGGEAAAAFRIEDGEIVEWRRVAVPGGERGAPAPGGAPI